MSPDTATSSNDVPSATNILAEVTSGIFNNAPTVTSLLNVAAPAALPSMVKNVVSELSSVPFKIISVSLPWASIVIFPEVVVKFIAASPAVILSAAIAEASALI